MLQLEASFWTHVIMALRLAAIRRGSTKLLPMPFRSKAHVVHRAFSAFFVILLTWKCHQILTKLPQLQDEWISLTAARFTVTFCISLILYPPLGLLQAACSSCFLVFITTKRRLIGSGMESVSDISENIFYWRLAKQMSKIWNLSNPRCKVYLGSSYVCLKI